MDETAKFVTKALARLPEPALPVGLNGALLAAYDARQARGSLWQRFCEIVWPGAPLWAAPSAFAAALLLGVTLGAVLPTMRDTGVMRFSLDQPANFSLGTDEDL
jgi:hypothetical protein